MTQRTAASATKDALSILKKTRDNHAKQSHDQLQLHLDSSYTATDYAARCTSQKFLVDNILQDIASFTASTKLKEKEAKEKELVQSELELERLKGKFEKHHKDSVSLLAISEESAKMADMLESRIKRTASATKDGVDVSLLSTSEPVHVGSTARLNSAVLPTFGNGAGNASVPFEFMIKFEAQMVASNMPRSSWARHLPAQMQHIDAIRVVSSWLEDDDCTWDEVKSKFIQHFDSPQSDFINRKALASVKIADGETIRRYVDRVLTLASRIDETDSVHTRTAFLIGLGSGPFAQAVVSGVTAQQAMGIDMNLTQMTSFALGMAAVNGEPQALRSRLPNQKFSHSIAAVSQTVNRKKDFSKYTCYNCGQVGHTKYRCPSKVAMADGVGTSTNIGVVAAAQDIVAAVASESETSSAQCNGWEQFLDSEENAAFAQMLDSVENGNIGAGESLGAAGVAGGLHSISSE
jgi:hypothetical protein